MKNKLFITLIILTFTFTSCNTKVNKEKNKTVPKAELNSPKQLSEIWKALPLKNTPITDTVNTLNFDNAIELKEYRSKEIELLQLNKIYPEINKEKYTFKFFASYKLKISNNFYTIILNVLKGEHEMESVLINYDSSNENLISFKTIAYKEVAESWSKRFSRIDNPVFTITDNLDTDGEQTTITKFHINQLGEINQIKTKFSSDLRPDKTISLNQIYLDTINFNTYNDDGDHFLLIGEKNGVDVSLIYNWESQSNDEYNFKYGDLIEIKWKMDSIWIAGDGETLDFMERAIDAKKIVSEKPSVKFLWRENIFDQELNQEVNAIVINQSFCNSVSNQEKAALGYISFNIGNDCWWDGKANEDRSNLKCKILTGLNLGYQCSDKQLDFLRKWFSKDQKALKELEKCRTIPYTATVQTTFDEISITTNEKDKTILVNYKAHGTNFREAREWSWTEKVTFSYTEENVILTHSEKSELINESLKIEEN